MVNVQLVKAEDPPKPPEIPIPIDRLPTPGPRNLTQSVALAYIDKDSVEIQFTEQIGVVAITIADDLGCIDSITADSATETPQLNLLRIVEGQLTITIIDSEGIIYIGLSDF